MSRGRHLVAVLLLGVLGALAATAPAAAAESGEIVLATREDGTLQVVFQADGLPPGATVDLDSVTVTIDGRPVEPPDVELLDTGGRADAHDGPRHRHQQQHEWREARFGPGRREGIPRRPSARRHRRAGHVRRLTVATGAGPDAQPRRRRGGHRRAHREPGPRHGAVRRQRPRPPTSTGDAGVRSVLMLSDGEQFGRHRHHPGAGHRSRHRATVCRSTASTSGPRLHGAHVLLGSGRRDRRVRGEGRDSRPRGDLRAEGRGHQDPDQHHRRHPRRRPGLGKGGRDRTRRRPDAVRQPA